MDCTECTMHVQHAIAALPGVHSVDVFLASEKALVRLDPAQVDLPVIRQAVEGAGYSVPDAQGTPGDQAAFEGQAAAQSFTRQVWALLGVLFGVVLFVVVVGEWLGLFEAITERVPWPVGLAIVMVTVACGPRT